MSLIKSKIIGLLMFCLALLSGIYYTICVFLNGTREGVLNFFRDDTLFGIPILNEYWTIALPSYIIIIIIIFIIGWIGIATLLIEEPKVTEEEFRKVKELDEKFRKQEKEKK